MDKPPTTERLGWIYIAANISMPGLLNIGFTRDNPEIRVAALSGDTAVPTPFYLCGVVQTANPSDAEKRIHLRLADHRVSASREFFKIPRELALQIAQEEANKSPQSRSLRDPLSSMVVFCARLKSLRVNSGMTQQEVADLAGVSRIWVNKAEQGKNIQLATLFKVINALGGGLDITFRE